MKGSSFTSLTTLESKELFSHGGLRTKKILKSPKINQPLVTIITAVYNGEEHLEETIQSIVNQDYGNLEYIIIDGGSKDRTLEIIKKYEDQIDYWVSEKDEGISDAFNKGVILARGNYINFQGDGDGFCHSTSLSGAMKDINPETDILISTRIQRISQEGKELFTSKHISHFHKTSLLFKMSLPHQGLFTQLAFFRKYGLFDTSNTFCMDYEHLLRAYQDFPNVITKNLVTAKWRADGIGNGRVLEIFKEYNKIKHDNKVAPKPTLTMIKYWTLAKFYIKNAIG